MRGYHRFGRSFRRAAVAIGLLLVAFIGMYANANAATEIYSRGTGGQPGVIQTPLAPGVTKVISNDNGYVAEIWPLPNQQTRYNDSVNGGVNSAVQLGKGVQGPVVLGGYSQGATVAGDAATKLVQDGVKPASEVRIDTDADPRLRNTGFEVVMQKYNGLLSPIATMRGERPNVGIAYHSDCAEWDAACVMEDPAINPGGAVASLLGFGVLGYHGLYSNPNHPSHTVTYEDGAEVRILDTRHPFAVGSEQLIKGPVTPEFEEFVNELAPGTQPGSDTPARPDLGKVVASGIDAIAAAAGVPAPNLNLGVNPTPAPAVVPAPVSDPAPATDTGAWIQDQVETYTGGNDTGWSDQSFAESSGNTYSEPIAQITTQVNTAVQQIAPNNAGVQQVVNNFTAGAQNLANQFAALTGGR